MTNSGPRHRGACAIDERPTQKRRFYRVGLRVSHSAMLSALKASNDALEREQSRLDEESQILFMADVSDIRFLRLQHQLLFKRG